jgi:hypothetical protein
MSTVTAEFPFIRVRIDTSGLQPKAKRAFGNVAVVGSTGGNGTATPNTPIVIGDDAEARKFLASLTAGGGLSGYGRLYKAVRAAMIQDPPPSRIYAVATDDSGGTPDYASAIAAIAAAPVQFVCLAGESDATALGLLHSHVEAASASGNNRMGVAMVDPDLVPTGTNDFATEANTVYGALKSDTGRMVLVAGRKATTTITGTPEQADVAAAAMGAMAGHLPHISVLMKQIRDVKIPLESQFSGSEIKGLAERFIIPVIDPDLIPGEGLYLGSGRTYTTDTSRLYVDVVRVIDDIEFRLKAGLIGSIGNVRIDRLGMQALSARFDGILGPLQASRVIDTYQTSIPLLPILEAAESARSPGQVDVLTDARTTRVVEVVLSIVYAGSVHFLDVSLALKA